MGAAAGHRKVTPARRLIDLPQSSAYKPASDFETAHADVAGCAFGGAARVAGGPTSRRYMS